MKYYRITCFTPFVGEENDYYIATESKKELVAFADECTYENGFEWCDDYDLEMHGMTEEDYYFECGCHIEEITEQEYLDESEGA